MKETEPNKTKKINSQKIILGTLFILTFVLGWMLGHQDSRFGQIGFGPNITGKDSQNQRADFSQFWHAWDLLEEKYDGQIDYQKMITGAIKGMTEALGDPYTAYLSPDDAKELESELTGVISGIGAEVGLKNNKVTVIAPIDDSPAKKAGLMSGDIILAINDESTEGMDINTAVNKIRGEEGTKVKLAISRDGEETAFEIERAKVTIKNISTEIKPGNIGYVSVSRFDDNTTSELREALNGFKAKKVTKVVLDLRDNPGGYLDESVSVTSQFLANGIVVSERQDTGSKKVTEYKAIGGGAMTGDDIKIVVLVNKGSASASEIVAGALQDRKRATIVGETTFGKGSVQEIENLPKGAKMRITIAHWYTPNGKNIGKEGIKPDVEVKLTENDYNQGKDPQLDKALEILK